MSLPPRTIIREVTILITALAPAIAMSQTEGEPPIPPTATIDAVEGGETVSDEGLEVLTRAPLHEAFATPVEQNPQPGELVEAAPPELIEELPPEVKPEGENVEWIPGYWAWDEEEERYIWISGVWRSIPPGREWVPGYWAEADGGHRWVSGYWGAAAPSGQQVARSVYEAAQQAEAYVAPPPESLDVGPISPQPSDQHFWVPGCWIAGDAGYRWRAGYWHQYQPNWVWVPDHYVWTPAGCVFVPGYWDYTLHARGMVFAPVYFRRPLYLQPRYVYRPYYALEVAKLALHLFVHPRGRYYCYGDYYGPRYASFGYRPWFQLHFSYFGSHSHHHHYRHAYDPLLAYYGTHFHRHGIDYLDRLRGWHRYYDRHADHRPPRTFDKETDVARRAGSQSTHRHVLARSVDDVRSTRRDGQRRVVELDRADRQTSERIQRQIQATREVARRRQAVERNAEMPRPVGREQGSPSVIVRGDVNRSGRSNRPERRVIDRQDRQRDVITSTPPDAGRDNRGDRYRRAVERARELARDARQEDRAGVVVRSPTSGDVGRPGSTQRPAIVRGQEPREAAERRNSLSQQRVLRLDPSRGASVRDRAVERIESSRQGTVMPRSPFTNERAQDNRQQALEAARRAQQAAAARQRSLEAARSLRIRPNVQASGERSGALGSYRAGEGSPFSGRMGRESATRPQLERFRPQIQRAAPPAQPRQRAQPRTTTSQRFRAQPPIESRSLGRATESRPRPSVGRPTFKADLWRSSGRSSAAATTQRGPRSDGRSAPAAGGPSRGRGRSNR